MSSRIVARAIAAEVTRRKCYYVGSYHSWTHPAAFKWTEEKQPKGAPQGAWDYGHRRLLCRESEATMIAWLNLCQGPEITVFITDANGMPRANRIFGDYD